MKRLIHDDIHAGFDQISGACQARRTGADHSGLFAGAFEIGGFVPVAPNCEISDEALKPANGDRFKLVADNASGFTLDLLRANASAHRRERVRALKDAIGLLDVFSSEGADEPPNVNPNRASGNASGLFALEAAIRFGKRHLQGVPLSDFFEIFAARLGILLGHLSPFRSNRPDVFHHPLSRRRLGHGHCRQIWDRWPLVSRNDCRI